MAKKPEESCALCTVLACEYNKTDKFPPFCPTAKLNPALLQESLTIYENDVITRSLAYCAATIEADFYCRMSRVEETIEFIKRQRYGLIGVATCVGLLNETRIFASLLKDHGIHNVVVGCKIGATSKADIGIGQEQQVDTACPHESMCNPALQALYLNSRQTDFNVMIGLCVGHDSIFLQHIKAPTTVLIAKDRVLAHNPAGALYTAKSYYAKLSNQSE